MKQDVNTQNNGSEKITMNDVVKTLNTDEQNQLKSTIDNKGLFQKAIEYLAENNRLFQKKANQYFNVKENTNEEELLQTLNEAFKTFFDATRIVKGKDFKKGDLVSLPFQNSYLKGKVFSIQKDTLVIKHLTKGLIEVPKKNAVIMFPGQRYDAREVSVLFPKGGIEYKDLPKTERLKLLSGKETKPVQIEYFRTFENEMGEPVKKMITENVRFQIQKDFKTQKLDIKPIRAYGNKIYNKDLSNDEISKLKNGTALKTEITTKAGKTFSAILFWDKELKGVRAKAPNTKPKQQLNFKGYKLDKSELEKLNNGQDVKINIKNAKGESIPYTLKYNMEFDHLQSVKGDIKVSNGLKPNDDFDGDGLTNAQEESIGSSKFSADTDGDGLTDAQEVKQNTDPNDVAKSVKEVAKTSTKKQTEKEKVTGQKTGTKETQKQTKKTAPKRTRRRKM